MAVSLQALCITMLLLLLLHTARIFSDLDKTACGNLLRKANALMRCCAATSAAAQHRPSLKGRVPKAAAAPVSSMQGRSRPTGLPLPRKASTAGPIAKPVGKPALKQAGQGPELSVTEMMQWLDSKLGQSCITAK